MTLSTVQTNFLLYGAFSFISAFLIGALFWGKEDRSSKLWILGCLVTSISSSVTVFRTDIPLVISYSLMVALELASVLMFSDALKNLSGKHTYRKISWYLVVLPVGYFLLVEFLRIVSNAQVTAAISAMSTFLFGIGNLICIYQIIKIREEFNNKLFLNIFAIIFIVITSVYFLRSLNVLAIDDGHAFLTESLNVIIWFLVLFFGVLRNFTYIALRLQLGFTEHSRLNNMNLMLSNSLEERDALIQSLERLNKSASLNSLATTIAHEISQPLTASRLFVELAINNLDVHPSNIALHKESVQDILIEIERAAVIVKNLSNLNGAKEQATTLVNLLNSLVDVTEIAKIKLRELNIKLEINCLPEHFIQVNDVSWYQVLMNILNNAMDALASKTDGDRKITISVQKVNDMFEVSLQDNGIGIPVGQEVNIFHLSMSTKKSGSGIGLWLVRNIIESYGGNISAKNNLNGGALFIINMRTV